MGIQKYGLETFVDSLLKLQQTSKGSFSGESRESTSIELSKNEQRDSSKKNDTEAKNGTKQEKTKKTTTDITKKSQNGNPADDNETAQQQKDETLNDAENSTSPNAFDDYTMVTGIDLTPYLQSLNIEMPNVVVADPSGNGDLSARAGYSETANTRPFHHTLETLASPWIETSRSEVEPRYHSPKSFTNITGVLGTSGQPQFNEVSNQEQNKVSLLQDETLFYLFYKHPTSAVQELTYIELRKRNWRYHKLLKVWLTKDPVMEPIVQPDGLSERGKYIFFDPTKWEKCQRDFILHYTAIM
ncbi:hypothetical protein ACO0QE_004293 [Hanseniaspora vineae]